MVSDAVRTLVGPLVQERYVTDVTIYTAHHRLMVRCSHHRFTVRCSDSFSRSLDPLAIIYRTGF